MVEVKEVLRQWLSGKGLKSIARWVRVDRNTVRRYIQVAKGCGLHEASGVEALTEERLGLILETLRVTATGRPRGDRRELCERHREAIQKLVDRRIRLTKVRKLLLRQGIDIPYPTLYRFATSELSFGKRPATIPVADCGPAEEAQVDTGWMGSLEPDETGRRRRFRAFVFTSVCTRYRFVYPTFSEGTADAIEACEEAWAFFDGVFKVLIPDNAKAIVLLADPCGARLVPAFLEYAQSRGFLVDPTRVRSPQDKGRVERAIQHVRDDCFAGEKLKTIEEARRHARQWCLADYGTRRHTRTLRMPREHFEAQEKRYLLPAPAEPYDIPLRATPKVARDQHASVARALYSLPRAFLGKTLEAVADRLTVRFYHGRTLIKVHPRKPPGGRSTDPADFPPVQAACALRDIDFFRSRAREHGDAVGRFAEALLAGPLPWTRMRRVYALLGLCRRYGDQRVDKACALALEVAMINVRRLERMLQLPPAPVALPAAPRAAPTSRYLRPPSQYALFPQGSANPELEGEQS
jgi:transposase